MESTVEFILYILDLNLNVFTDITFSDGSAVHAIFRRKQNMFLYRNARCLFNSKSAYLLHSILTLIRIVYKVNQKRIEIQL